MERPRPPDPGAAGGPSASEPFWREFQPGDPFPRPRRVGSCEIVEELGRGGFGIVYRAVQDTPRRVVALKLLRPGLAGEQSMRRMRREAEILARLDHPNIARVYEAGEADLGGGPQPYFVMEYIEGRPLLEHARGLPLRERARLFARICRALQHAHQKGVVHRDVNPANVLVRAEDGEPKVIDFGVAMLTKRDPTGPSQTRDGQMIGTLPYMSPEQVRGLARDVDTLSDVYSLGVLGFQLLTGELPYRDADVGLGAVPAILHAPPRKARAVDRRFPRDLELILDHALQKERGRRYRTADALAGDVEAFLAGRPIAARAPSVAYLARRWAARNPGQAAASALAALFLVGGFLSTSFWLVRARRAGAELEQQLALQVDHVRGQWGFFDEVLRVGGAPYEAKRAFLEGCRAFVLNTVSSRPENRTLSLQLARITVALASLEIDEGDEARGLALLDEADALLAVLAAEAPPGRDLRRLASLSEVRRGDVAGRHGHRDVQRRAYRSALERDQALADELPRDARVWDDLCWSLERCAYVLRRDGEAEQARLYDQRRHAIALDLLTWDPEPLKAAHNACASHLRLAESARTELRHAEALDHGAEALALSEELIAARPDDPTFLQCRAAAMSVVGAALRVQRPESDALDPLARVVRESTLALRRRPADRAQLWFTLACHSAYGRLLEELGERELAVEHYRSLLALPQELVPLGAPDDVLLRIRAVALARLARAGAATESARGDLERFFADARDPGDCREWIHYLLYVEHDPAAALAAIDAAEATPVCDPLDLWNARASALIELERFGDAQVLIASRSGASEVEEALKAALLERLEGSRAATAGAGGDGSPRTAPASAIDAEAIR